MKAWPVKDADTAKAIHAQLLGPRIPGTPTGGAAELAHLVTTHRTHLHAVPDNRGGWAAAAALDHANDRWRLRFIAVAPEAAGAGAGRALLHATLTAAWNAGATAVYAELPALPEAVKVGRFYARNGAVALPTPCPPHAEPGAILAAFIRPGGPGGGIHGRDTAAHVAAFHNPADPLVELIINDCDRDFIPYASLADVYANEDQPLPPEAVRVVAAETAVARHEAQPPPSWDGTDTARAERFHAGVSLVAARDNLWEARVGCAATRAGRAWLVRHGAHGWTGEAPPRPYSTTDVVAAGEAALHQFIGTTPAVDELNHLPVVWQG